MLLFSYTHIPRFQEESEGCYSISYFRCLFVQISVDTVFRIFANIHIVKTVVVAVE